MTIDKFAAKIATCEKCRLREARNKVVVGRGDPAAKILFVGEGPGRDEDHEGRAFVGNAGEVLNNALEFGGFKRTVRVAASLDDVSRPGAPKKVDLVEIPYFIDNMVRCRPPENRKPEVDEVDACWPWMNEVLETIRPKVIVPMGDTALQGLARKLGFKKTIGTKKITELVGRVIVLDNGTVVVPAFHPAYIARRRDMAGDFMTFFSYLSQSYPNWLKIKGKISA